MKIQGLEIDKLNSLDLRSDLENDNIIINKESKFHFADYVGNRPQDFVGDEHEDDTWAIDLIEDGQAIATYLYCSKFEYEQDKARLLGWLEPLCDEVNDVSIRITNKLIEMGFVPDCTDTDDETEFEVQEMIREVIHASKLKEYPRD